MRGLVALVEIKLTGKFPPPLLEDILLRQRMSSCYSLHLSYQGAHLQNSWNVVKINVPTIVLTIVADKARSAYLTFDHEKSSAKYILIIFTPWKHYSPCSSTMTYALFSPDINASIKSTWKTPMEKCYFWYNCKLCAKQPIWSLDLSKLWEYCQDPWGVCKTYKGVFIWKNDINIFPPSL